MGKPFKYGGKAQGEKNLKSPDTIEDRGAKMKEGEKVDHLEQLYSEVKEGRKQWPPPRGCKRGPRETPAKKSLLPPVPAGSNCHQCHKNPYKQGPRMHCENTKCGLKFCVACL